MISIGVDAWAARPAISVSRAVFGRADAGTAGTPGAFGGPGERGGRDGPGGPAAAGGGSAGARPALLDAASGRTLSYAGLATAVGSAAAGLAREGIGPGTVVGLHLPDSPEFAVALHAVTAAGAVPFPLRASLSAPELSRLLAEAGARTLVTWPVLLGTAQRAAAETLYCFGDEPGAQPFSGLMKGGAAPDVPIEPARDAALLACTRGTAGPARPVRLTHAEVVAGLTRVAAAGMLGTSDIVLSALPFSDVLGLNGALNPALRLGATVVTLAGTGRHDLLRALQEHAVTVALLPPRLVEVLAYDRAVPRYRLGALRAVVSAGGPLGADAARACAARLGCPVRQAYGFAEAAGFTHLNLRALEEGTLDSVGRGLPDVTWRVVSARTGCEQPAYQPGELCVRLPVTPDAAVPARWLATGDAAFADEHGRAFVLGRLGDGRPEPPAEPEAVLAAHPAVRDAAVAPAPDLDLGLAPHAFVVLDEPVPAEDLLGYVNGHVPPYRRVLAVHVVDLIPRTPGGCVQRRGLLERAGLAT
ncbi:MULTISPECIES: class I adenylate-forming enzyme family protein [Actinomadura]|uniref:Class I adenylate-forming enzyme family protein n=1 Tax=Actinomadura yumaensis TaxID=111807 RepID=A0ABW2CXA2_9ACTN|nr:AMP-binding protein [Actinomadura sp. J1-007]MWK32673.1 AMP-binding protein [Actinomadura sp. J1-007]